MIYLFSNLSMSQAWKPNSTGPSPTLTVARTTSHISSISFMEDCNEWFWATMVYRELKFANTEMMLDNVFYLISRLDSQWSLLGDDHYMAGEQLSSLFHFFRSFYHLESTSRVKAWIAWVVGSTTHGCRCSLLAMHICPPCLLDPAKVLPRDSHCSGGHSWVGEGLVQRLSRSKRE
jgi:hypothetical protein